MCRRTGEVDLQSVSQCHLTCPSKHRHRATLFIPLFWETAPFSRLLRHVGNTEIWISHPLLLRVLLDESFLILILVYDFKLPDDGLGRLPCCYVDLIPYISPPSLCTTCISNISPPPPPSPPWSALPHPRPRLWPQTFWRWPGLPPPPSRVSARCAPAAASSAWTSHGTCHTGTVTASYVPAVNDG